MTVGAQHTHITERTFFGVLLVVSAAALWHAGTYEDFLRMSTFTFSHWCSAIIFFFCGLEIYSSLRSSTAAPPATGASWKTLGFAVLVAVYAVALHAFSYYIATILFIPIALLFVGGASAWRAAIFVAVGWLLFVYLVFEKLFSIVLPQ